MVREGYQQTEVGMIPEDWEVGALKRFWSVADCKHITAKFVDSGIPIASIKEVQSRFVSLDNAKQTTTSYYNHLIEGGRKPQTGDLILSRNATVGEVAQVADWHPPFAMGQDVCLLRKKSADFSTGFLQSIISSWIVCSQLEDLMVGSTFRRVNVQQIKNLVVPMPGPEEQRSLAQALSDVDALIAALDKAIAKNRHLKTATMQQLLTGKKRLPGFGEGKGYQESAIGVIPEDWAVERLKTVSSMSGRIGWQGLKQEEFTFNDIDPFLITGMNFKDGKIRWDEVYHIPKKRYQEAKNIQLEDGDILMTKDGTIGKLLYVEDIPFPKKASLNSHLLVFRPLNYSYYPKFLFYQLSSKQFADYVDLNKSGSTFFGITQEAVGNYNAYLPPIEEQRAIATVLSDMDAEIAALETRRAKTQAIKQGMMQALLTGRVRLV